MPRQPRVGGSPEDTDGPVIIGRSAPIRALLRQIQRVAPTDATVLIQGERGTGKELVARAIQRGSRRQDRPFVIVNCAALPPDLLASELFDHVRGAFTGAWQRSSGLLAAADGGTLFLDEIGDLALAGQAMLLRFLQDREVRPLGSTHTFRVDVRVIAATNRDLTRECERQAFRADLYDRLSEVVLEVPPLRARGQDVALLADHFLGVHARRHGRPRPELPPMARRALAAYSWPGNVRELEKAVSRAVLFGDGGTVRPVDLGFPAPSRRTDRDPVWDGGLTRRQCDVLRLAETQEAVSRGDVMAGWLVSRETARRDLVALVRAGLLQRVGAGRGSRYLLARAQ